MIPAVYASDRRVGRDAREQARRSARGLQVDVVVTTASGRALQRKEIRVEADERFRHVQFFGREAVGG